MAARIQRMQIRGCCSEGVHASNVSASSKRYLVSIGSNVHVDHSMISFLHSRTPRTTSFHLYKRYFAKQ